MQWSVALFNQSVQSERRQMGSRRTTSQGDSLGFWPGMEKAGRLLLVDGHAYAYRSFFAIRSLRSPAGVPSNALFRGVFVGAGSHRIEMRYHANGYIALAVVELLALAGSIALLVRARRARAA